MPRVLTTNAQIVCPHGGMGTSIPSRPIWSIEGGDVLLDGDTGLLRCPFSINPCTGYNLKSMKLNSTFIEGRSVLLTTDFQQSDTGLPLSIIEKHATFDETTVAPLPKDNSDPELDPALKDYSKPSVQVRPTNSFVFNRNTPSTIAFEFALSSPYPFRWVLTFIDGTRMRNIMLTEESETGIVLSRDDGIWGTPNLKVSVFLDLIFLNSLNPTPGFGKHSFFMTGITQRGISAFAECSLSVI